MPPPRVIFLNRSQIDFPITSIAFPLTTQLPPPSCKLILSQNATYDVHCEIKPVMGDDVLCLGALQRVQRPAVTTVLDRITSLLQQWKATKNNDHIKELLNQYDFTDPSVPKSVRQEIAAISSDTGILQTLERTRKSKLLQYVVTTGRSSAGSMGSQSQSNARDNNNNNNNNYGGAGGKVSFFDAVRNKRERSPSPEKPTEQRPPPPPPSIVPAKVQDDVQYNGPFPNLVGYLTPRLPSTIPIQTLQNYFNSNNGNIRQQYTPSQLDPQGIATRLQELAGAAFNVVGITTDAEHRAIASLFTEHHNLYERMYTDIQNAQALCEIILTREANADDEHFRQELEQWVSGTVKGDVALLHNNVVELTLLLNTMRDALLGYGIMKAAKQHQ